MTRVWDTPCANHTEKLVLLALADNANDEGYCWPSTNTIARKCDLTQQGVLNRIESLETVGLLEVKRTSSRVNHYILKLGDHPTAFSGRPEATTQPRLADHPTAFSGPLNGVGSNHNGTTKEPSKGEAPSAQQELDGAPKPKALEASMPPEAVYWNGQCGGRLPTVMSFGPSRLRHLKARRADPFWVAHFEEAIRKVKASSFCCGSNDRGWTATFDWLVERPDAVAKLMEGKYDNRQPVVQHRPSELERRIAFVNSRFEGRPSF